MTWTNMNDTNPSANYTFGFERLTCICKEGNVTVATTTQTAKGPIKKPTYAFASEIDKGNIVALSTDTGNTLDATDGLPVVQVGAAGTNFGIVMSDPRWDRAPAATATTWATMLTRHQYRIAEVWVACTGIIEATTADASSGTAITPGDAVIWDLSSNGFVQKISGGFSAADGKVWNITADDEGANGYIALPIALHYSASDTGKSAIVFGLIPILAET